MRLRVAQRGEPVLHRRPGGRCARGAPERCDVRADERREVAAGARDERRLERHRHRQAPRRVALGLLLERDGEHALVDAGHHELGRDDRGRPADAAGGVHADHRLARPRRARRRGRARASTTPSNMSGALPIDDGVDVGPRHARVLERLDARPRGRARPSTRRGGPRRGGSDRPRRRRCGLPAITSPSRTQTRFCCRHGPCVAWATPAAGVARR